MKKISYLLLLLAALMVLPFSVFAEGEEDVQVTATVDTDLKVNVYLFRGDGCPHCQEAEEWFNTKMEEGYGNIFRVIDFEVWYNQDNAALMNKVAEARAEEVGGVPYIIVGNKSWNGFTSSFGDEILEEIKSEYSLAVAERHDMSAQIPELANGNVSENNSVKEEKQNNDAIALIIILAVTGAICFGIYKAREHSK